MNQITQTHDLVVLGGGPAGYTAAIRAAQLGRKVTLIERESLGGICLNWGCIPTKALLKSAQLLSDIKRAEEFGIRTAEVSFDFAQIIDRSRQIAAKLENGVNFLMRKNKIEVLKASATIDAQKQILIENAMGEKNTIAYNDLIIATGSSPKLLSGIEIDGERIHTSRSILASKRLPEKILIIGAGAIGVEFAYFFNALGVEVCLIEMLEQILPHEDGDIAEHLRRSLTKKGIVIKTNCAINALRKNIDSLEATLQSTQTGVNENESWSGDCCLLAIGVKGNTENLGLENLGIKLENSFIVVDEYMRTNLPNHYAIGDVAGAPWLAHVASHEGIIAAEHASGQSRNSMHYDNIPSCTYCQPQVASVGLTEKQARQQNMQIKVSKIPFTANGKAMAIGETEGFVKVISDANNATVLGVHILHAEATELISEAAIVRSHNGKASSVASTIHPHPTLSEALAEALGA